MGTCVPACLALLPFPDRHEACLASTRKGGCFRFPRLSPFLASLRLATFSRGCGKPASQGTDMKKRYLSFALAVLSLLAFLSAAAAADLNTDIFDWQNMGKKEKVQALNDIQKALKGKGLLGNVVDSNQLLPRVEAALARDSEQAIMSDKVCEVLRLDCSSIGSRNYR